MENCVRPRLRRCPGLRRSPVRNPGLVEQSFHDCSSVRGDLRFFSLWEGSECKLGCTWGARIVTCVVLDYCDFRGVCGSVCTGTHVVAEQPRGGCHGPVFLFSLAPNTCLFRVVQMQVTLIPRASTPALDPRARPQWKAFNTDSGLAISQNDT